MSDLHGTSLEQTQPIGGAPAASSAESNQQGQTVDGKVSHAVEMTLQDLREGLVNRSLQHAIDDVNSTRQSLTPKQYSQFIDGVNEQLAKPRPQSWDDKHVQWINPDTGRPLIENLPNLTLIAGNGHDDSNSITFVDPQLRRAVTFDPAGRPLHVESVPMVRGRALTAEELKGKGNDAYSELAPPGLGELSPGQLVKLSEHPQSASREGLKPGEEYPVIFRDGSSTANPDGSTSYSYTGALRSARDYSVYLGGFGMVNVEHRPDATFHASETVSADNKILKRHVEYDVQQTKATWGSLIVGGKFGGKVATLDDLTGSTLSWANELKSVDVQFDPQTGRYATRTTYLGDAARNAIFSPDGKTRELDDPNKCQSDVANGIIPMYRVTRDQHGLPATVSTRSELASKYGNSSLPDQFVDTWRFERDADGGLTRYTDANGQVTAKTGPNLWKTANGVFTGNIYTDNSGNIVKQSSAGTEIIKPYGKDGERYLLDQQNRVVQKETGRGEFRQTVTDTFNNEGQVAIEETMHRTSEDATTIIRTKPHDKQAAHLPLSLVLDRSCSYGSGL